MYVCMHVCMHVRMYVCMYVCGTQFYFKCAQNISLNCLHSSDLNAVALLRNELLQPSPSCKLIGSVYPPLSNDRPCPTTLPPTPPGRTAKFFIFVLWMVFLSGRTAIFFCRGFGWSDRNFSDPGQTATLVVVRQGGGGERLGGLKPFGAQKIGGRSRQIRQK